MFLLIAFRCLFWKLLSPNQHAGLVDLYDVSDDWIPIYDKSDLKGYYQAIGTSGNQFKTGDFGKHSAFDVVPSVIEFLGYRIDDEIDGESFLGEIIA